MENAPNLESGGRFVNNFNGDFRRILSSTGRFSWQNSIILVQGTCFSPISFRLLSASKKPDIKSLRPFQLRTKESIESTVNYHEFESLRTRIRLSTGSTINFKQSNLPNTLICSISYSISHIPFSCFWQTERIFSIPSIEGIESILSKWFVIIIK